MAQFLLFMQVMSALLPIIRKVVNDLNVMFPESGMGNTKFTIAMHYVTGALNTIEGADAVANKVLPLLEPIIRTAADGVKALQPKVG